MTDLAIWSSFAVGVAAALLVRSEVGVRRAVGVLMGGGRRDMKMVMVVRADLELNKSTAASHCAGAAINCYKKALVDAPAELKRWKSQGQTKVVTKAPGEAELMEVMQNAGRHGLVAELTYTDADAPAVLGLGPGPAQLIDRVAGHLKLF